MRGMKINDVFCKTEQTFSFEFSPPQTPEDIEQLLVRAQKLKPLGPHFISVTYGAGGSTRRNTIDLVARFQDELGILGMSHLTCVGHNQAELGEILQDIKSRGIENIMCLRGDPPRGQDAFTPAADGFSHAHELVSLTRSHDDFCIGVAGYPEPHPDCPDKDLDLKHLKDKVDCGADFVTTQLFYDNRDYFDFVKRARQSGITCRIIPGIMPILNYAQIVRITKLCGAVIPAELHARLKPVVDDPQASREIGIDWAWRQCEELLAVGAPGIHFYTMNRSFATQRIFERLRESSVKELLPPLAEQPVAS
jgi:methylenetetrahydrofolate reductase (NADPH)